MDHYFDQDSLYQKAIFVAQDVAVIIISSAQMRKLKLNPEKISKLLNFPDKKEGREQMFLKGMKKLKKEILFPEKIRL